MSVTLHFEIVIDNIEQSEGSTKLITDALESVLQRIGLEHAVVGSPRLVPRAKLVEVLHFAQATLQSYGHPWCHERGKHPESAQSWVDLDGGKLARMTDAALTRALANDPRAPDVDDQGLNAVQRAYRRGMMLMVDALAGWTKENDDEIAELEASLEDAKVSRHMNLLERGIAAEELTERFQRRRSEAFATEEDKRAGDPFS